MRDIITEYMFFVVLRYKDSRRTVRRRISYTFCSCYDDAYDCVLEFVNDWIKLFGEPLSIKIERI